MLPKSNRIFRLECHNNASTCDMYHTVPRGDNHRQGFGSSVQMPALEQIFNFIRPRHPRAGLACWVTSASFWRGHSRFSIEQRRQNVTAPSPGIYQSQYGKYSHVCRGSYCPYFGSATDEYINLSLLVYSPNTASPIISIPYRVSIGLITLLFFLP